MPKSKLLWDSHSSNLILTKIKLFQLLKRKQCPKQFQVQLKDQSPCLKPLPLEKLLSSWSHLWDLKKLSQWLDKVELGLMDK